MKQKPLQNYSSLPQLDCRYPGKSKISYRDFLREKESFILSNASYFYSAYNFQNYFGVLSLEASLCCALNTAFPTSSESMWTWQGVKWVSYSGTQMWI